LLLGIFVCFSSQGIFLLSFPRLLLCSNRLDVCVWIGLKKFMIQGGTVMVLNGGPVAQRGRQEQPRKAELVQKFGPLFSPSLSLQPSNTNATGKRTAFIIYEGCHK
jgi:hypothetical protein